MPPCGRADFGPEISCGATCLIWAPRPVAGSLSRRSSRLAQNAIWVHNRQWVCLAQRQRPQNSTSAPGDAIWGAHRCNYIHGQFGGIFFVPQVPPAPRCTPVVISTKLTSRLSLAPCCACQPSFGHIQAAPRRALAPVESPPGLVIWPVTGTQKLASFPKASEAQSRSRGP